VTDAPAEFDLLTTYWAETDPEQAEDAKKPYKDVKFSGSVEGRFIYTTGISKHVLPFCVLTPATVVLPIEDENGSLNVVHADQLMKVGYREIAKWMKEAEQTWDRLRGDKADKQTVYERLEYQGGLSAQNLKQRHLVLYNAAGTNVSAAYFDRTKHPRFVVEYKLYWAAFSDEREAHHVSAVLNSNMANKAKQDCRFPSFLLSDLPHKATLIGNRAPSGKFPGIHQRGCFIPCLRSQLGNLRVSLVLMVEFRYWKL
jgi:hypothetical protein